MAVFPFSAIVEQESLKRALLLGVIQPGLGGVLVRGTKGVAKSTAVRALAALLPAMDTVAGCPFQRRPGEVIPAWPLPADAPVVTRPVPLVELPLGATEDRVLGDLHLEKALRGERALEPGLLASANRGILYVDEVNLLADHLVDVLLDASASGVHRLEREGLSLSHPARFLLIGTMNPEEGELRPQLLDRFGLAADVADLTDPAQRAEAVRRRLAFEADPAGFSVQWRNADAELADRIVAAQRRLPAVHISDDLLKGLSERCLGAAVEGLRSDLTLCQAACAWAAFQGRQAVEPADIDAVAPLALAHRRRSPPDGGGDGGKKNEERGTRIEDRQQQDGFAPPGAMFHPPSSSLDHQSSMLDAPAAIFDIEGRFTAAIRPPGVQMSMLPGKTRSRAAGERGPLLDAGGGSTGAISWAASLRRAALRQGSTANIGLLQLCRDDLRFWRRRKPAGRLLLFVVDGSGSMAAWRRMRRTKAAILALLGQAYQHRDRVALLLFRGMGTELVLPPTSSMTKARRALEELGVGGATPLADGLAAARRFIMNQQRRQPGLPVWTVILTDGRANVPLHPNTNPANGNVAWADAVQQARLLAGCDADWLVIDTETGWPCFGRARELAVALGADYRPLDEVLGQRVACMAPGQYTAAVPREVAS
ncbi:hypothetical protein AYO44_07845 [Planctomycetaceae bacterium SCGC AG-212-F19]|nr:hypothetical protein AYO44_07845 [Planctomycetaceae bacterium SCGC AG-212-F19]